MPAIHAIITLTCLLGCSTVSILAAPISKPNIIVILIDDMGYGDIGPFGATKQATPHLDRMADEGMILTSFYAAPACSVARAQLLTGCYGQRVSVPWVYFPASENGLNPKETTIAEHLKAQGYTTTCIGKWHLGDQAEFLPTRHGFDHYFGIPYSNDMQIPAKGTTEPVVPLLRQDQVVELLTNEQQRALVQRFTDEAISFIRQSKDQPFFLYLPHTAIHTPILPSKSFIGSSRNNAVGDWIQEVDSSTGRILDTLRELKIDQRTLVLFTSDNGPWLVKGPDSGSPGTLRGGKGSTWEGGMRVPTLAWWPQTIPANRRCDAVAGLIDVLPTAVELAGGQLHPSPTIDGRSLVDLLTATTQSSPRDAQFYFLKDELQAVRQGPWKLAIHPQTLGQRDGIPMDAKTETPRLYNLDSDIGETTNIAHQHPEIVSRLLALTSSIDAQIGRRSTHDRRPAGHVKHPSTLYPTKPKTPKPKR